jgi:hypothetical protein
VSLWLFSKSALDPLLRKTSVCSSCIQLIKRWSHDLSLLPWLSVTPSLLAFLFLFAVVFILLSRKIVLDLPLEHLFYLTCISRALLCCVDNVLSWVNDASRNISSLSRSRIKFQAIEWRQAQRDMQDLRAILLLSHEVKTRS